MVDKFNFMAVYGSKTTLETKVPSAISASFHNLTMDRHKVEGARPPGINLLLPGRLIFGPTRRRRPRWMLVQMNCLC
jgi:hypothetical protein